MKPTNGRLPARDVAGLSIGGPISRRVIDAVLYLRITHGIEVRSLAAVTRPIAAAWSDNLGYSDTDPQVAATAYAAAQRLVDAGVITWRHVPLELRDPEPAWRALRDPTADHAAADTLRAHNNKQLDTLFGAVDLLLTPTTPNPPHGHAGPGRQMSVSLTWAFNISGHPAVSVPAGFTDDGCPVGLQLIARHQREELLLQTAAALERLAPWPAASLKSLG